MFTLHNPIYNFMNKSVSTYRDNSVILIRFEFILAKFEDLVGALCIVDLKVDVSKIKNRFCNLKVLWCKSLT